MTDNTTAAPRGPPALDTGGVNLYYPLPRHPTAQRSVAKAETLEGPGLLVFLFPQRLELGLGFHLD